MTMTDKQYRAYSLWLKVHPRYYDTYGYQAWRRFNDFISDLYDWPYDCHQSFLRDYRARKATRVRVNKYTRDLALNIPFYDVPRLLTLTFNDDALCTLNKDTRLRYVKDWLNRNVIDYIGCIDYGKINRREHYHFIVNLPFSALEVQHVSRRGKVNYRVRDAPWDYGFMCLYDVYEDLRRTAAYAFKSSSYAFKSSSSTDRVFHKRGVSHWLPLFDDDDLMGEEFPGEACFPGDERQPLLDK